VFFTLNINKILNSLNMRDVVYITRENGRKCHSERPDFDSFSVGGQGVNQ